ncbi:MAG: thioredoxin family protein [Acidobacteriota bacterium]
MRARADLFSAGCLACEETIALVKNISCESCDVTVLDMRQEHVAARAKALGIHRVPAVVINGKLADCCSVRGPEVTVLKAEGLGVRL